MKKNADMLGNRVPNESSAPYAIPAGDVNGKLPNWCCGSLIDQGGGSDIKIKIIDIGDWDMDATVSVTIAHGLTFANIRPPVSVLIRNDINTTRYEFVANTLAGYIYLGATNVILVRTAGSIFDSVDYDSTSFNRGWISLTYVE